MRSQTASAIEPRLTGRAGRSALTLLEVLLSFGILAIAMAVTLPFLGLFRQAEGVSSQTHTLVQTLREAQHRAQNAKLDRAWGVRFLTGSYVLFGGETYAGRLEDADETLHLSVPMSFSGSTEIVFQKITGKAVSPGQVQILLPGAPPSTVTVNSAGGIDTR